jgi:hypothetical protein
MMHGNKRFNTNSMLSYERGKIWEKYQPKSILTEYGFIFRNTWAFSSERAKILEQTKNPSPDFLH